MIKVSAAQFEQDVIMNILEKLAAAGDPNTAAPGFMDRLRKTISDHIVGASLLGAVGTASTGMVGGDLAGTASVNAVPAIQQTIENTRKAIENKFESPTAKVDKAKQVINDANNAKRQENVQKIVDGKKNEVDSNYMKIVTENPRPAPKVDLTHAMKPFMSLKGKK